MIIILFLLILIAVIMVNESKQIKADENIAIKVYRKLNNIAMKFDAVGFKENKFLSTWDILGIICVESGHLIDLPNKEIIGDDGRSFGYMQVSAVALADVNKSLKTNYNVADIKENPEINILIGSHYLELCIEKAIKEKSRNPKLLGYRKYNSGIDNAKDSNMKSLTYGIKVLNYVNLYRQLVKQNKL